jgi:type II secretory pathway component PulF
MSRSGVDVATALESLVRQCRQPALAAVLGDVHDLVMNGKPFSQAVHEHVDVFGPTYGPSHKKCPIGIDAKWA